MKVAALFLHLIVIALIASRLHRRETVIKKIFWPALLLKLSAGIAVGLLYLYYYPTGDTWAYFRDARLLSAMAREDLMQYAVFLWSSEGPGSPQLAFDLHEPRALFLIKIISLLNLVSLDSYWVASLYFSLLSFLGARALVRALADKITGAAGPAAIAFLFFPSVVFWSSGLIKESLAMASLYFLSAIFIRIWFAEKITGYQMALGILSIWILWNLKYYFGAVFFPVVLAALLFRYARRRFSPGSFSAEISLWLVLFVIPSALVSLLHPNFSPGQLMSVIVENNRAFSDLSAPGDLIHFYRLERSPGSLLLNSPWALVSGLFRPAVWESGTVLQLAASIENLLLLVVALACLTRNDFRRSDHRVLIFSALVYIFILCIFITLSTPNFGTLARYRVGYLPFFVLIICCGRTTLPMIQRSWDRLVRQQT